MRHPWKTWAVMAKLHGDDTKHTMCRRAAILRQQLRVLPTLSILELGAAALLLPLLCRPGLRLPLPGLSGPPAPKDRAGAPLLLAWSPSHSAFSCEAATSGGWVMGLTWGWSTPKTPCLLSAHQPNRKQHCQTCNSMQPVDPVMAHFCVLVCFPPQACLLTPYESYSGSISCLGHRDL